MVLRDRMFYATSHGGVTVSGGEPLLQAPFATAILAAWKKEGLHTALDTSGVGAWEDLRHLLPVTDLVILDVKHVDKEKHRLATGRDCTITLRNAARLIGMAKDLLIRVPIVPGFNDTEQEVGAICETLCALLQQQRPGAVSVELVPFHKLAGEKYRALGIRYRAAHFLPPSDDTMSRLRQVARFHNLPLVQ